MNKSFLTTTLTPLVALVLCCLLYVSGNFQIIFAAVIVLLASAIEHRKKLFSALGFQRKNINAKSLLVYAPLLGIAIFLIYGYILIPTVTTLTGEPMDFSVFEQFKGDLSASLSLLLYIWISAAFGEEIVFRGYLMTQFTKFLGSSKISLVLNILIFGVLFGFIHAYQGISGQIITGIMGMLLAVIFHIRKNDLWFNVVLHGCIDTVAVVYMYYGWAL